MQSPAPSDPFCFHTTFPEDSNENPTKRNSTDAMVMYSARAGRFCVFSMKAESNPARRAFEHRSCHMDRSRLEKLRFEPKQHERSFCNHAIRCRARRAHWPSSLTEGV